MSSGDWELSIYILNTTLNDANDIALGPTLWTARPGTLPGLSVGWSSILTQELWWGSFSLFLESRLDFGSSPGNLILNLLAHVLQGQLCCPSWKGRHQNGAHLINSTPGRIWWWEWQPSSPKAETHSKWKLEVDSGYRKQRGSGEGTCHTAPSMVLLGGSKRLGHKQNITTDTLHSSPSLHDSEQVALFNLSSR